MTPKEKATYLVSKFFMTTHEDGEDKAFALICVEEIISACEYNNVESWNTDWWNKVKSELEKL